jgi:uncharacterized protein (DUF885 family)
MKRNRSPQYRFVLPVNSILLPLKPSFMKKLLLPFVVGSLLMACGSSDKKESGISLDTLFKNYQEERLKLFPLLATSIGDNRYNDIFPNDISQSYRGQLLDFYQRYKTQLESVEATSLNENDRLSYDILLYECSINIEGAKFKDYLLPISQIRGATLQVGLLASGKGNQPFKTVKDYENWLSRLDGYVVWCDTAIANMRKGMAQGYTIPKPLALKIIPQMAAFDHGPAAEHHFYSPIKDIPADFSAEDKDRVTKAYTEMIETRIIPIHAKLKEFIEKEYAPACRETSGIDAIPGGKEWYAYAVKRSTTTSKTADEIFALGNSEVERISIEMEKVKEQVGFKGSLKDFFNHLREKKELRPFKTADEVIAQYNAIHEQMKPNLEKLFDMKPKMAFEVRRIEAWREKTTAANYNVGSVDGTRPGIFYFPIQDGPEKYSYMQMEDLFLHEAIPGHHYQIALKVENTALPEFRRFINYGAYTEGWALYTESLGKELGLYTDPYSYFGMLSGEMHRAIRLVVDAGLHSQGWTREQAIQYSKDHEAAAESNIISEIERYMANPAQALSYKMGQLKILELRANAEKELGDKFDIKQFHNQMLDAGSLPLDLLDVKASKWIEGMKAK